jgi:hypothetical protein
MVNSVGEYVAGEEYDLDDETSDRFVVLGYAEGDLSRKIDKGEREKLRDGHQQVSV